MTKIKEGKYEDEKGRKGFCLGSGVFTKTHERKILSKKKVDMTEIYDNFIVNREHKCSTSQFYPFSSQRAKPCKCATKLKREKEREKKEKEREKKEESMVSRRCFPIRFLHAQQEHGHPILFIALSLP